jgi:hypothetical protein
MSWGIPIKIDDSEEHKRRGADNKSDAAAIDSGQYQADLLIRRRTSNVAPRPSSARLVGSGTALFTAT